MARSSNSLEIDNFLESILFNFFFSKFRQFWPKYLETIEKLHNLIPNHYKNYYPPSPPQSMLEKLAGNTSGSFVNTLCNIEMGGMRGIKSHISIFLCEVDLFQHFWPRLQCLWKDSLMTPTFHHPTSASLTVIPQPHPSPLLLP